MQPISQLTLNANPTNFFAETEQMAFHPGHPPLSLWLFVDLYPIGIVLKTGLSVTSDLDGWV